MNTISEMTPYGLMGHLLVLYHIWEYLMGVWLVLLATHSYVEYNHSLMEINMIYLEFLEMVIS